MKKQWIILLLALILALSGCQPSEKAPDSSSEAVPGNATEEGIDIQQNYDFAVVPIEGADTQAMAFSAKAPAKPGYLIDLLPGATLTAAGGDDWSESYILTGPDGVGSATISLLSCPADAIAYFGLKNQAELDEKLIAYIFTTDARHNGQVNAVKDFEYALTMDYYGTREELRAFQVEFEVEQDLVRSVRCLSANDDISENYAGISINLNLPLDDDEAYEHYMQMINSVRRDEQ